MLSFNDGIQRTLSAALLVNHVWQVDPTFTAWIIFFPSFFPFLLNGTSNQQTASGGKCDGARWSNVSRLAVFLPSLALLKVQWWKANREACVSGLIVAWIYTGLIYLDTTGPYYMYKQAYSLKPIKILCFMLISCAINCIILTDLAQCLYFLFNCRFICSCIVHTFSDRLSVWHRRCTEATGWLTVSVPKSQ